MMDHDYFAIAVQGALEAKQRLATPIVQDIRHTALDVDVTAQLRAILEGDHTDAEVRALGGACRLCQACRQRLTEALTELEGMR